MPEPSTETGTSTEGAPPEGTEQTSTPPEGTPAEPVTPDNKTTFDLDYVRGLRTESAGYRTRLRDTEAARDAAAERVSALESEVASLPVAQRTALAYEVALEKGLPLDLARRLQGETREDIEKDAEALARFATPADLGQGATRGEQTPPVRDVNGALRTLARGKSA